MLKLLYFDTNLNNIIFSFVATLKYFYLIKLLWKRVSKQWQIQQIRSNISNNLKSCLCLPFKSKLSFKLCFALYQLIREISVSLTA